MANTGIFRGRDQETLNEVSVTGFTSITLNADQAMAKTLRFTGTLAAALPVTLPVSSGAAGLSWYLEHAAAGGYPITVSPASGGAGVALSPGTLLSVYFDGVVLRGIGGAPPVSSIPPVPLARAADTILSANSLVLQPVHVPVRTKVRRARIRQGAASSGKIAVAIYNTQMARVATTGEIACPPVSSAVEIALPVTELPVGPAYLGLSVDNATASFGNNATYGDVVDGFRMLTAHPPPAALSSLLKYAPGLCISLQGDDPTPLSVAYAREDLGRKVVGLNAGKLYAKHLTTGHWQTSTDQGDTWTDQVFSLSSNPGISDPVQMIFAGANMYVWGNDSKLYRNTIDTFSGWTDVTGPWPANTTGRPEIAAHNGTVLLYGNYNGAAPFGAEIWRSVDDGDTWAQVLDVTTTKHVHAIVFDPSDATSVWASLGDFGSGFSGHGLYHSADSGATWAATSVDGLYGINMVIPAAVNNVPRRVILEGDGQARPHLMQFYVASQAATGVLTDGLLYPDTNDLAGRDWSGTARGIIHTSEGNIVYMTTNEQGAVGTRNGVWIARGPWFTTPTLLEDLGPVLRWAFNKTFESGDYLFNERYRLTRPKFAGQ